MADQESILSRLREAIRNFQTSDDNDLMAHREFIMLIYNAFMNYSRNIIRMSTPEDDADGSITRLIQLINELQAQTD
jgi:hypothetical protein